MNNLQSSIDELDLGDIFDDNGRPKELKSSSKSQSTKRKEAVRL